MTGTCVWGEPIYGDRFVAISDEAQRALEASRGEPVTRTIGGTTYLIEVIDCPPNSRCAGRRMVQVRPCVSRRGFGSPGVGLPTSTAGWTALIYGTAAGLGGFAGFLLGGIVFNRPLVGAAVGAAAGAGGLLAWTESVNARNERCAQAGWGTPGCDPNNP